MASGDDCNCQSPNRTESYRCSPENPFISIRKLVNLMENPISQHTVDRQILILDDFIAACPYAFWMSHLPYIIRLLELLCERFLSVSKFRERLKILLQKCVIPPMLTCTSEKFECLTDLSEYFSLFGYLFILLKDDELKHLVLQVIRCLLDSKTSVGICCASLELRHRAIELSQLPEIVSQLFRIVEQTFYEKLLNIALLLSEISSTTCQKMLKENILEYLLSRLSCMCDLEPCCDTSNEICVHYYKYIYKIIWILLRSIKKTDVEFKNNIEMPSALALLRLSEGLRFFTIAKGSELDRNTLLAIVLMILEVFENLNFVQLADDLAILCVATEHGAGGTWASFVKFSSEELDYQFKKMLLISLFYIKQHVWGLNILHRRNVMHGLLRIITPGLTFNVLWNPQHNCKLIILSLHVLQSIVPNLIEDFVNNDGLLRILMTIEYYLSKKYDTYALQICLKTFYSVLLISHFDALEFIEAEAAVKIFIAISGKILEEKALTISHQRCLAYNLCILEFLFEKQPTESESAVNLCINYMGRALRPNTEDTVHDPKSIICLIDFLWESTLSKEDNLKIFVKKGGVYSLLDVIQNFVFPVKVIGLGALVDLCESGSCIPYVVTWRGKGKEILPFLLDIFREENEKLGVDVTKRGVIRGVDKRKLCEYGTTYTSNVLDQERPLMGKQQCDETNSESKDVNSSPALVDLLVSCRPKLYALLQLLLSRHKEKVEITNEHYKMFNKELSYKDQITMLLLENFLALKLGETWVELKNDLDRAGIRPLAVDGDVVKTLVQRYYRWGVHLKKEQQVLLRKEKMQNELDEKVLYNVLKEGRLSSALDALHELDYIARTTENMFRISHKRLQIEQVNNSLHFIGAEESQHRTFMDNINVNPVFQQFVNIQSNKIIDPNEKVVIIDPVSSDTEDEQSVKHMYCESEFATISTDIISIHGSDD